MPDSTEKMPAKRNKRAARRGARVQDEDESEQAVAPAGGSDSESDFAPDAAEDDEDDATEDEADPATPSGEPTGALLPPAKATLEGPGLHPSWADLPVAHGVDEDLPTLDFGNLSLAATSRPVVSAPALDAPRAATSTAATPKAADPMSKKSLLLAKRIAKSDEAKLKDPAAWEIAEAQRKERELEKKQLKKERLREKRKETREGSGGDPAATAAAPASVAVPASAPLRAVRAPVPSRPSRTAVNLGMVPSAAPSPASSAAPSSTPATPAFSSPALYAQAPLPPRPSTVFEPAPSPYNQAREAYTSRLATDPSYTPRIGKFWGHDDRLMEVELRGLTPYWRGRGRGGEIRGGRGFSARGRGGMARGGFHGGNGEQQQMEMAQQPVEPAVLEVKGAAARVVKEDTWGRGEVARATKNATVQTTDHLPSWNHDGYEELKTPRPSAPRVKPVHAVVEVGVPGTVNPRYAHLPFHPAHRFPFPIALIPSSSAPLPPVIPQHVVPTRQPPVELAAQDVVRPAVVLPVAAAESAPVLEHERVEEARDIINGSPVVQYSNPQRDSYQTNGNGYPHQLPPHQQPQSPSPYGHPQQYPDPRHASPVYYPQYYPPEAFSGMHSPNGATPPPLHYGNPQQQGGPSNFFVPPSSRGRGVEIKMPGAPGTGSNSPSLQGKAPLKPRQDNFAPRGQPGMPNGYGREMVGGGGGGYSYGPQPTGEFIDANGIVYYPHHQQAPPQAQYYGDPQAAYYYAQNQNYPSPQDPAILSMGQHPQQQQQQRLQQQQYMNRYE